MARFSIVRFKELSSAQRWDAEFFVNDYIEYLSRIFREWPNWTTLRDVAQKLTSGHTPLHHNVDTGDAPFITVECVDELAIDLQKAKKVWTADIVGELNRVRLAPNDVLITIKRRIANSCPILDTCPMMAVNQDVAVLTPKPGFLPSFLSAVLASRVGKFQALQHSTEQMNPYLNVTTLGELRIPVVSGEFQKTVDAVVRARLSALRQSVDLYAEAEAEMLDRLGWAKLVKPKPDLWYVVNYKTVAVAGRWDAEFFQPRYQRLRKHLAKSGAMPIREFCDPPLRGVQPEYVDDGPVVVVTSKHLGPTQIEMASLDHTTADFYQSEDTAKARLQKNDVLLYATGAYVGRTNAWLGDQPALASNHVTIIRPNPLACNPIYLALFLNSPPGVAQSEQFAAGSTQRELYPSEIKKIFVFLPANGNGKIDLKWQQHLADKVMAANEARVTAKAKLEEAKVLVEREIEKRL